MGPSSASRPFPTCVCSPWPARGATSTATAGWTWSGFWTGASWGDFDNDRDLDLYVCGYVRYVQSDADRARGSRQFGAIVPYTLNPSSYEPERNLLYRNDGRGVFEEVAEDLGVANTAGRSLGALWHDFDEDGWLDLYVANDVSDNAFYHNVNGRFVDISHAAWVADYRGAMGLALADYDRDGDDDIFVTHWVAQENALYDSLLVDVRRMAASGDGASRRPEGNDAPPAPVRFGDSASAKGLGQIAVQRIGWGAEFADLDGDGWSDLIVANGSTFETTGEADGEAPRLKPQRSFLFWNRAGAYFHDLSGACPPMTTPRVSRGLAVSDYDRDGDQDILFVHRDGAVQLLRNDMQTGYWSTLRLRSRGRDGEPTGLGDGATIVATVGDVVLRRAVTGPSYLSQSSRTVHLGLGAATSIDRLEVRWLGGDRQVFRDLAANTCWELTEGDPAPRRIRTGGAEAAVSGHEPITDRERVVLFWSKQRAATRAMRVDDDPAAAIPLFREALALDPDHLDSRFYLGNCLAAQGDTKAAVRELEGLLEIDPRSHRTLRRLGVLYAMQGTPEELHRGLARLERALEVNREETGVLVAMSEIELIIGRDEQAEQRLEWVSRTNPRAVGAFYLRAYVAWKRGDETAARRLLATAREARGEEWKPKGITAEGDVARQMHADETPLSRFCEQWNGTQDPRKAFEALDAFITAQHPDGTG